MKKFGEAQIPTREHPITEYRVVFESLFLGTFLLISIISLLLFVSYFLLHNYYVISRILVCGVALLYLAIIHQLWNKKYSLLASRLLIFFYFVLAGLVLYMWGIDAPFGMLSFAIAIVLAGILLGARYTIYFAILAIVFILFLQAYVTLGYIPPLSADSRPTLLGDTLGYCTLLAILALISWLFGSQTERLLFKNRLAEKALLKEKQSLEVRVAERTEQLQKAQMKELQQLYQFAEMGQLSAALLHDLANHLSVLTFDIADLKKQQHTEAIKRAEESVGFLEDSVRRVRSQLHGKSEHQRFNVVQCVEESLKLVSHNASASKVAVSFTVPQKPVYIKGDPLRLSHILTILIRNGIESYKNTRNDSPEVTVTLETVKNKAYIRVRDNGIGLTAAERKRLFSPVKSTKKKGLGIGLFIATKIAETHFKGSLSLDPSTDYTEFILELPKAS